MKRSEAKSTGDLKREAGRKKQERRREEKRRAFFSHLSQLSISFFSFLHGKRQREKRRKRKKKKRKEKNEDSNTRKRGNSRQLLLVEVAGKRRRELKR